MITIYIAASWRHKHAVEMLTDLLEANRHEVRSFVRSASDAEEMARCGNDPVQWIDSEDGHNKFRYDVDSARTSDLVIYIGPSGCDAWAEVGAAYAAGRRIYGLRAKGEQIGLMRRMVYRWFDDHRRLVRAVLAESTEMYTCHHRKRDWAEDGEGWLCEKTNRPCGEGGKCP